MFVGRQTAAYTACTQSSASVSVRQRSSTQSTPRGSLPESPTLYQRSHHTSTQLWLPCTFFQAGQPTMRAGIPHARQASITRMLSPVQLA